MRQNGQTRRPIDLLMAAMDQCAIARGEAQFTEGYRAAEEKHDIKEPELFYQSRQRKWKAVGPVENRFHRLALRLLREAAR